MSDDRPLEATRDFDVLREPVWARVRGRHGGLSRERFEDAYAEWWSREVARALEGRPSGAAAPAAFVAEGVHRVLLDEHRSLARGLARGEEKAAHQLVDIDDQLDLAAVETTPAQAAYEALAHRVLLLVRDRLSARELRVFVWTYLYLRSTPETAKGLGLSEPRVKKDRKKVAGKVGEEVWALLGAELAVCAEYSEQRMSAAFEVFTLHAEDCPECSRAVGGLRDGALAIVGPIELVALAGTGGGGGFLEELSLRLGMLAHRSAEMATAMPGGARAAAVAAVGAAVIAGSTALPAKPPETRAATAWPTATAAPDDVARTIVPSPTVAATPASAVRPSRTRRAVHRRATPTPTPTAAATATAAGFESPPPPAAAAPPSPPSDDGEFGFEQ